MLELKLDQFEGPLDLLLHLIRTSKIDIYNIPIFELTEQYIAYLNEAESLNLDIASEFIVMASELLYIKSKMLLPIEKVEFENEEDDPRKELMEKLLDYQKYKELSEYLKSREEDGVLSHTKAREKIGGITRYTELELGLSDLQRSILDMVERIELKKPIPRETFSDLTEREVVSVSYMTDRLVMIIKLSKKIELIDAFTKICRTRAQVAATFMALLDLMKAEKVSVNYIDERFYLVG